jgi:hypothetical protein
MALNTTQRLRGKNRLSYYLYLSSFEVISGSIVDFSERLHLPQEALAFLAGGALQSDG